MQDNIIIRFLTKVFDLILLNILWIVFSIPIITIGASTTALYTVTLKMVSNEEGYIAKEFWKAFKENLKQGTIIWLVLWMIGMALGIDCYVIQRYFLGIRSLIMITIGIIGFIWMFEMIFVFPVLAKFDNSIMNTMKNAIMIPVARLPYAFLTIAVTVICIVVTLLSEATIMTGAVIWSVIGVATLTYANSFFIVKIFEPYLNIEE